MSTRPPSSARLPQTVQVSENLVRVVGRGYLVVGHGNLAVGADQDRDAPRPGRVGFRRAVGDRRRLVLVAAQVVGEPEFLPEGRVVFRRIEANAENGNILARELLDSITEPIAFGRSPRRIGLGIPPEQDILACVLLQRHGLAVLVGQRESRRRLPDCDQCHGCLLRRKR